jgi:hypothetical protein
VEERVGTVLPPSYQALDLKPNWNCVYLHLDGVDWKAYVTAALPQRPRCLPAPPSGLASLLVRPSTTPGFDTHADVPAVARFHEGSAQGAGAQPFFGVKCGEAWCMIMPNGAQAAATPHEGMMTDGRQWVVRGWHDAQHLAVQTARGTIALSQEIVGTAAPGPGASFDEESAFENGFVHASTIHFRKAPNHTKYKDSWKFREGVNEIFIVKQPNTDEWAGRIYTSGWLCSLFKGSSGCYRDLHVAKDPHHGVTIPATSRFRWDERDEGVWVRCADGCCKVSGT